MSLPPAAAAALDRLEMFGVRLGLERMRALLAALGDPQRRFPAVLVAGTNGKGSTAAFLEAMARAAGYRTGLYTSPHLERVEERLRLDGHAVDGGRLGVRILEALAAAATVLDEPPTYFEAVTAAAFLEMAAAGDGGRAVDLAVVEVGLGGRLDATNTVEPVLSLIAPISLEHREHLGDTLTAIAGEKAGVLRAGRPAIAWSAEAEVVAALDRLARALGARLTWGQEGARIEGFFRVGRSEEEIWAGQDVTVVTASDRYRCSIALLGGHQRRNLAHAVLAAEALRELGWKRLGKEAIEAGAATVRWPGRLEVVALSKRLGRAKEGTEASGLGGPPGPRASAESGDQGTGERAPRRVLLDVGHNPGAAVELASFLESLPAGAGPVDLLFGLLADKDPAGTLGPLLPHVRRAILTRPPHGRGRDPEELRALVPPGIPLTVEPEIERALDLALHPPEGPPADTLLACGSFYLVGAVRTLLRRRFGVPSPASDQPQPPPYDSGS